MNDRTARTDRLAALGAHLGAGGFKVELIAHGLKVTIPSAAVRREGVAWTSEIITCRPRAEDARALWFFTSTNEPVAPADRIIDAKVFLLGYLAQRDGR